MTDDRRQHGFSMPSVHFRVHHTTTDVEELDEPSVARLLTSDPDFVASLCDPESLEGALVIDDVSILDDLGSATQRLCFEAVATLAERGATYEYPYFTSNPRATLVSSKDGATVALSGDYLPPRVFSRAALLRALHACGLRYLDLLEDLGRRGRTWSATDLSHLRPFAARAQAHLQHPVSPEVASLEVHRSS